jgi:hypothetical protein
VLSSPGIGRKESPKWPLCFRLDQTADERTEGPPLFFLGDPMFKENNDKFNGIIAAKGLATLPFEDSPSVPAPHISAESKLVQETEEYLASLPVAKQPDPNNDEDAESDEDE